MKYDTSSMKKIKQYIVNTFTDKLFSGNPAAICLIEKWLPDELMMKIAMENKLSETAFVVRENEQYKLRWFTPKMEIDLCGHATLAATYVITSFVEPNKTTISFHTRSGVLKATRKDNLYYIDLPAFPLKLIDTPPSIVKAIGVYPIEVYLGRDLVCVLPSKEDVYNLTPNLSEVEKLEGVLLHVTAKDEKYDCISRTFAPKHSVPEDPVCGSGHCHIIPYWSKITGKNDLLAYQASSRGGVLHCHKENDRIIIAGECVLYSKSYIFI